MKKVEIEIFADEIVTPSDFNNKKRNYLIIGILFVPVEKKKTLLENLTNKRCLYSKSKTWFWKHSDCPFKEECKKEWHDLNNTEIHHEDIRKARASKSLIDISKGWLKFLINNNRSELNLVNFNLLYIDLNVLNIEKFGTEKEHENIYNKFFRTAINYGVKTFFNDDNQVIVKRVFHDNGSMKDHGYFPFLNLHKLADNMGEKIKIENTTIEFLDSNHKTYLRKDENFHNESQLIQFIDLILGTFTQNILFLSNDKTKKEVATIVRPLVSRMLKNPKNKNSSYHYYNQQKISIFPKYPIEKTEIYNETLNGDFSKEYLKDQYHTDKELEMPDRNQELLTSFFYS